MKQLRCLPESHRLKEFKVVRKGHTGFVREVGFEVALNLTEDYLLKRSMKSVKSVQERSSLRLSPLLRTMREFMYSVRNLVRLSREKMPWMTDINWPWNFGRTNEVSNVTVLSELLSPDCFFFFLHVSF